MGFVYQLFAFLVWGKFYSIKYNYWSYLFNAMMASHNAIFLMEQCYTTVHLLTNYQRYFSLNLRCMTFFLLQHHSNAVLIDFHYYIYPKFNICTLFSVFVSDNTANRFCTVPSKNSNDLLLGGKRECQYSNV